MNSALTELPLCASRYIQAVNAVRGPDAVLQILRESLSLRASPCMAELNRGFVDGKISIEEAIDRVRAKYRLPPIPGLKESTPESEQAD